eukprot:SAG11_NODE_1706_length_4412_cov_3.163691_4_plen_120_part_00
MDISEIFVFFSLTHKKTSTCDIHVIHFMYVGRSGLARHLILSRSTHSMCGIIVVSHAAVRAPCQPLQSRPGRPGRHFRLDAEHLKEIQEHLNILELSQCFVCIALIFCTCVVRVLKADD